jgi:translation elongation factor EF-1alpha
MSDVIFTILDCYSITGLGVIPVGSVTKGTLFLGMSTTINGEVLTVKSIEQNHKQLPSATIGASIGVSFSGNTKVLKNMKGMEITFSSSTVNPDTVKTNVTKPQGLFSKFFGR